MDQPKSEMKAEDKATIEVGKTPKPAPPKPAPKPVEEHPTATAIKIGGKLLGFFHLPGGMDVPKLWDEFKKKNEFEGDKPHAFPIMFPGFLNLKADEEVKAAKQTIELEI